MLYIKRSLISLMNSGSKRSILLALSADTLPPDDSAVEDTIQSILGHNNDITGNQALDIILEHVQRTWLWPVILKMLYISHRLIVAPQSELNWLKIFLKNSTMFDTCAEFSNNETEENEIHSKIIQRYSLFLRTLGNEVTSLTSVVYKPRLLKLLDFKIDVELFNDQSEDEMMGHISIIFALLYTATNVVEDLESTVHLMSPITELVITQLYHMCTKLYTAHNIAMMECIKRSETSMNINDLESILVAFDDFIDITKRIKSMRSLVIQFNKELEDIVDPPKSVRKRLVKRIRTVKEAELFDH